MSYSQPPYLPWTAVPGGLLTKHIDTPVYSVFLALYAITGFANLGLWALNMRKGHKMHVPLAFAFFCLVRVTVCGLELAWVSRLLDVGLPVAAQILVNIGVVILYVINVVFAQRLLRATHPSIGWNTLVRSSWYFIYFGIFFLVCLVTGTTARSYYTMSDSFRTKTLWIQRVSALLIMLAGALSPFPLLFAALFPSKRAEKFGTGSNLLKIFVVMVPTIACSLISIIKVGSLWTPPRPFGQGAWWDSRVAFYCFNYMLEFITMFWYLAWRYDKLFYVPDGSRKRKSYQVVDEKDEAVPA